MPAASPVTAWLPLLVLLFKPGPVTETEDAFDVLHEIVEDPGADALVGFAEIDPLTGGDVVAVTVNDAVRVIGPPEP